MGLSSDVDVAVPVQSAGILSPLVLLLGTVGTNGQSENCGVSARSPPVLSSVTIRTNSIQFLLL